MKFLIVDDSPTMRRILVKSLNQIGYSDVTEAEDGKAAYAKMAIDRTYDFLITDWNMPVLNGLELVQKVRVHPEYKKIPILMVTTRGNKEDILAAIKAKVNNYVVKPFTPNVLKEKIDKVLNS